MTLAALIAGAVLSADWVLRWLCRSAGRPLLGIEACRSATGGVVWLGALPIVCSDLSWADLAGPD